MTSPINLATFKPLYTPKQDRPMHLVVFGSGHGSNLEALLEERKKNPGCFEIKALLSDRPCRFQDLGHLEKIPVIDHSFQRFVALKGLEKKSAAEIRLEYDEEAVRLLLECAALHQFSIDLILLAGYMRLVKAPLLSHFNIINVHPADLTILDGEGKRKYIGADSVYLALQAGETKTSSCVFLVDEGVDNGPILVTGPSVDYTEGYPLTKQKALLHQAKQKVQSDLPACLTAIKMIAEGRIAIDSDNKVHISH